MNSKANIFFQGANWLSPVGPMNFTFARNLSKANTDQVESFSFNLGTTF